MIPKKPQGVVENDSLASLWAKVRWLSAYSRMKWDRYISEHNGRARIYLGIALLLVMIPMAYKLDGFLAGYYVPALVEQGPQVQKAWVQFLYYLAALIVSAVIMAALAPKPPKPESQTPRAPEAEDGKAIVRIYGTVWIDDPMVLGWKSMGQDPIKKKGGKK